MIYDDEVRKRVERVHRRELELAHRAYNLGRKFLFDAFDDIDPTPDRLAWLFTSRALAAFRSCVNLFCLGDETDALSVCRTLMELHIDFEFIWLNDTRAKVQRYFDFGYMAEERLENALSRSFGADVIAKDRRRHLEPVVMADPQHEFSSYEEYAATIDADRNRVRTLFSGKNQWTKEQIRQRAEAIGNKAIMYDVLYFLGSEATHSNIGSMTRFLTPKETAPSAAAHSFVLGLAMRCFCAILQKASEVLQVPVDGLDQLAADADVSMTATERGAP